MSLDGIFKLTKHEHVAATSVTAKLKVETPEYVYDCRSYGKFELFFVNFPISFLMVYGGYVDIISTRHLIVKSNRGEFAVTRGVTVPTNQTEGDRLLIRLVTFTIASFSGAKEVDIAATLEHIRDQRMLMAKTKVTYLLPCS